MLGWTLVNSTVSLAGYYAAAFTVDKAWMGRRRMQASLRLPPPLHALRRPPRPLSAAQVVQAGGASIACAALRSRYAS